MTAARAVRNDISFVLMSCFVENVIFFYCSIEILYLVPLIFYHLFKMQFLFL